jgi:hypothetical protein
MGLKRRLAGGAEVHDKKKSSSPGFMELIAAHPAAVPECVIEFESRSGGKIRIHWKGSGEEHLYGVPIYKQQWFKDRRTSAKISSR